VVRVGSVVLRDFVDVEIAGRLRILTASAALLRGADGEVQGILTLVDDVTNHRQLTAELRHANTMEIRGQVASRIAHDFNNLLTLIAGYAEILSNDLSGDERSTQMVRDIQATASRASLLTGQLQTIGRTNATEPVVFNPAAIIQSNAEVLERILGGEIELHWELDEAVGNVRADADQFEQMILNLSINARDAMPDGGVLRIATANVTLDSARAVERGLFAGDFVMLSVVDTGVGMDEATRERCFEPLFTTKGPFKGTGMGLSSARRLVDESGGAIRCSSKVGQGTTFEILLPVVDEPVVEVSRPIDVARPRGSATVLLAEDDEVLRRLMSQVLQRNGYQVIESDSAERALELAGELDGAFDLLLSDVVMGGMNGRELAATLQSRFPTLRVLLTSGTQDASVVAELTPGQSSFLAKPFKPSELIDGVHELLTRRG
jgi:two-component system cell cycle sensor histidine kinase/response regulator CckA